MAPSTPKKLRVPVHGVLLLDKDAGLSSNDALIKAKRLLNAQKAGHTGTLDPFATGLLPLCFGEATKFSQDLLEADKTYETLVHLGIKTTTGDTEGDITETRPVDVSASQIDAALVQFRGEISQVPPMYSALKRDGKPLYEYARAGITLEREARRVTIYQLDVLSWESPFLRLRVRCSKGTYIRVLGEDIGKALTCGGHLKELRRTGVGALTLEGALSLESLNSTDEQARTELLAPVDALLLSFPRIGLDDTLTRRFLQGQRLALGKEDMELPPSLGRVRVYRIQDGQLLGTARLGEYGILSPERLIALAA
jgi:tRNA pseudouridine55 synthase